MTEVNFNQQCQCDSVALNRLYAAYPELSASTGFAKQATYVSVAQAKQMQAIIQAIEMVIKQPAYRQQVLSWAPSIANEASANLGVCMGYDFHLSPQGPQLIEINTNAGGLLLCALASSVQEDCCILNKQNFDLAQLKAQVMAMFMYEWQLQRAQQTLTTIAIVDDNVQQQPLYPEFLLFKRLFEEHGIKTVIAEPQALTRINGRLYHNELAIDLVYNRLTDFYLTESKHAALAEAYLAKQVVLTPNPYLHALYANKRNLVLLSDEAQLREWQVEESIIQTLITGIPHTILVDPKQAEQLRQQRKKLFFKPLTGYSSRGAYRGDRITHRVFNEILQRDYIAQTFAPPSERYLKQADKTEVFKIDVRNYVYAGQVQLLGARLYQGQTTNFRVAGAGFSPVTVYENG